MEDVIEEAIPPGDSASGQFGKDVADGTEILRVEGDASATSLDFEITAVTESFDAPLSPSAHSHGVEDVDASGGETCVILHGLEGIRFAELTVTNDATTEATLHVFKN